MTSTIYNINNDININNNHSGENFSSSEQLEIENNLIELAAEEEVSAEVEIGDNHNDDDEDEDDDGDEQPPPKLSPIIPNDQYNQQFNSTPIAYGNHLEQSPSIIGNDSWQNTNGNGNSNSTASHDESFSGISRSGRVRKKNSLLAGYDFETSDTIPEKSKKYKNEPKAPRKVARPVSPDILSPPSSSSASKHKGRKVKKHRGRPKKSAIQPQYGKAVNDGNARNPNSYFSDDAEDGELEIDLPQSFDDDDIPELAAEEIVDHGLFDGDDLTGDLLLNSSSPSTATSSSRLKSQAQSTYMLEKSLVHRKATNPVASSSSAAPVTYHQPQQHQAATSYLGAGKIKISKKEKLGTQPKRMTAYLLWAQEQKNTFVQKYPHMDYTQQSKKLTEIWSGLPANQKKLWKIRASKTMKAGTADNIKNSGKILPPKKPPGKRGRKSKAELLAMQHAALYGTSQPKPVTGSVVSPPTKIVKGKRGRKKKGHILEQKGIKNEPTEVNGQSSSLYRNNYKQRVKYGNMLSPPTPGTSTQAKSKVSVKKEVEVPKYKVTGHGSFDVAAHLSLLGESLTNIGDRLKEHEGDKVSGSLSVLLDTLICATGPLLCLTQEVKELNCIPPEKLKNMLDCFAMIMPGI